MYRNNNYQKGKMAPVVSKLADILLTECLMLTRWQHRAEKKTRAQKHCEDSSPRGNLHQ